MPASKKTVQAILTRLKTLSAEQRLEVLAQLVALEEDEQQLREMAKVILLTLGKRKQIRKPDTGQDE